MKIMFTMRAAAINFTRAFWSPAERVEMSTRRGVGAKRADIVFSWARSGMIGADFAEGDACGASCFACFLGEAGAEVKATAEINSNDVGIRIRMGRRKHVPFFSWILPQAGLIDLPGRLTVDPGALAATWAAPGSR